ncbi:MAG: bifunctional alpha,alpha-trehalose-phosphate synthase (UDP-forming)/trehalose-phosphatase [Dinghuibacter sp.]|nr:bifunctional alpha,alpha-trehalose-phosphate synthase (UDP-forming)/trehalose-phosphatase [Dinghuibacter sp.]
MRLIIISNRLPVTLGEDAGATPGSRSIGGLAVGLSSYTTAIDRGETPFTDYAWFGWTGAYIKQQLRNPVEAQLQNGNKFFPVYLPRRTAEGFYHNYCNRVLWPLFHFFPQHTHHHAQAWKYYEAANELFFDQVQPHIRPGDVIWVHDYHLMLLPAMLRRAFPENPVSFFLHIPFPAHNIFCHLPRHERTALLNGLLGADVIGFHTYGYAREFLYCLLRDLDLAHNHNTVEVQGRRVKTGIFPMGIDYQGIRQLAESDLCKRLSGQVQQQVGNTRLLLSVDRLDYTKGILNRLKAFSAFLLQYPEWRRRVVMMLVVAPSRREIESYAKMKNEIDEWVGKINGEFCENHWTPVVYQYRQLDMTELTALYHASDVALITPFCDGMNLIAKEYVASGNPDKSVLVLSEMAGAIHELRDAIPVNPFNVPDIVSAIYTALRMPPKHRRARNMRMHRRLNSYDVHRWAADIMQLTLSMAQPEAGNMPQLLNETAEIQMARQLQQSNGAIFFLDYDGTLSPLATDESSAKPLPELLLLLELLCAKPGVTVVIISGRDRHTLERWFRHLDVELVSDFGGWHYRNGSWRSLAEHPVLWKQQYRAMLEHAAPGLPGSHVEEKEFSLVWDYRVSDPELRELRVKELLDIYAPHELEQQRVELFKGAYSLVLRSSGTGKGSAVRRLLGEKQYDFILAAGDDDIDEDMFREVPAGSFTIRVGKGASIARYRLPHATAVQNLLHTVCRFTAEPVTAANII